MGKAGEGIRIKDNKKASLVRDEAGLRGTTLVAPLQRVRGPLVAQ